MKSKNYVTEFAIPLLTFYKLLRRSNAPVGAANPDRLRNIMYRLGWPCATFFAEIGVSLLIKVEIIHDNEANVYVATSPDLKGLVVEAETLDELEKEVWELVPELLTLDKPKLRVKAVTYLSFQPAIAA